MLTRISKHMFTRKQSDENCSTYALSNLLRYYDVQLDPDSFYKRCMKDRVSKILKGGVIPDTLMEKLKDLAKTDKKVADFCRRYELSCKPGASLDDIREDLENDIPVMVVALALVNDERKTDNLHYMVVTGLDENNVYMLDSYYGNCYGENMDFYNRVVSRKDFLKMWKISDCKCGEETLGELAEEQLKYDEIDNIIMYVNPR